MMELQEERRQARKKAMRLLEHMTALRKDLQIS